jgi:hypothetical protein
MKTIFACISLVVVLSACNKCGHCELNGTSDNYYCEGSNKEIYDATKTVCEKAGGTWVVK